MEDTPAIPLPTTLHEPSNQQPQHRAKPAIPLPTTLHPEQRLQLAAVEALVGIKKSKIYTMLAAGKFPVPERDGPRCCRWRAGDILDYMQARRAALQGAQEAA